MSNLHPSVSDGRPRPRRPEILAPAGDVACLRAALTAGADAVYLGIDEGFNARARARNFPLDGMLDVAAEVHRAGARLFVTLNTLIFEPELRTVARVIEQLARARVDAIIVQDPAVALIARGVCPALHVHASTQMTTSSGEGAHFAAGLGVRRIVVPRELSVAEIGALAKATPLEIEVFVHGALCMSWSGQCLTSEAWGGRSANRGQCAQSCRLPYDLVVDGQTQPLGDVRYLLSPLDLSGVRAVRALCEIGVHSLKIEGRLKGPAYVTAAVEMFRRWVDAVAEERDTASGAREALARDLARASVVYSRGFSDGFLGGADHQNLVEGRFPKHRGTYLGRVARCDGKRVHVVAEQREVRPAVGEPAAPLAFDGALGDVLATAVDLTPGMGVVFDSGAPEDTREPGGAVYEVQRTAEGWTLAFGRTGPDLRSVTPGMRVWITGDPRAQAAGDAAAAAAPHGRCVADLIVSGRMDEPLRARLRVAEVEVQAATDVVLGRAEREPIDAALLEAKLGAFGGTPLRLGRLDASALDAGLHLPVSALKQLRRALVAAWDEAVAAPRPDVGSWRPPARPRDRETAMPDRPVAAPLDVAVEPLVRTDEQLDAVIALGLPSVTLDWMEMVGLQHAVARARRSGLRVGIATTRVQKPGEEGYDRRVEKLAPDRVLVRHWGALVHFAGMAQADRPALDGDFSLNVANSETARWLLDSGLDTVTAAHDLDVRQLAALLGATEPSRVVVVAHHHIATFHTEHCVYAAHLSQGRDFRTCGRPCESHRVALRDTRGIDHPVIVDVGCRNTVFNGEAQSGAAQLADLVRRGVRRLRVEFVWETAEETSRVLTAYRELVAGTLTVEAARARIAAVERFGVTDGTMRVLDPGVGKAAARHQPRG